MRQPVGETQSSNSTLRSKGMMMSLNQGHPRCVSAYLHAVVTVSFAWFAKQARVHACSDTCVQPLLWMGGLQHTCELERHVCCSSGESLLH